MLSLTDLRFQAAPAFAGIVETGSNLVKKPAFFHQPIADILDSVQKTLPAGADRLPVAVTITRLGFRENNSSTSETATLVAEFEFFSPDKTRYLGRQQVRLAYQGREITDKHCEQAITAFVQALGAFAAQAQQSTENEPVTGESFASLAERASVMLRDTAFQDGIYASYEDFLRNKPAQPVEFEAKGGRERVLYTLDGKKRPVKESDPIWGVYHQRQLYIYELGIFFPAYAEDARLVFVGVNTKSQSAMIGVVSGVLSDAATVTGKAENKRPYIVDWQTGGFYLDSSFVKSEIISFEATYIDVPDRKFNIVEVSDARFMADSAFIGVFINHMTYANIPLLLEKPLASFVMEQFIQKSIPERAANASVIMKITRLGVWENPGFGVFLEARFEFIKKENNQYWLLHTEEVSTGPPNIFANTKTYIRNIEAAFEQALKGFSTVYNQSLPPIRAISAEEFRAVAIPKILAEQEWKEGVYKTFNEFLGNAPSQAHQFYKDENGEHLVLFGDSTSTKRRLENLWGLYKDNQLYLIQGNTMFPASLDDRYQMVFQGYNILEANNHVTTTSYAFGLIGGLVAANTLKPRYFLIDWQTGSFYEKP